MRAEINPSIGHDARVAIVRAIAEVDPAAINDVVDHLDRTTVDEDRDAVITALAQAVLSAGTWQMGTGPLLRGWVARHG